MLCFSLFQIVISLRVLCFCWPKKSAVRGTSVLVTQYTYIFFLQINTESLREEEATTSTIKHRPISNNVRVAARNIVSQRQKGPVHVDNSPRPPGLSNSKDNEGNVNLDYLVNYSVEKVPELCQRCKKLPPYVQCHNRVCAKVLRRKYLCITCNQKAHQGIGDRDHKRNQIPQVVSPKIANVSSNKKYGKESKWRAKNNKKHTP